MPVDYRHRSHASRTIYHAWLTNPDEFFFNTWLIMKVKFSFTKIYPKKALRVDFVSWMYPKHYSQEKKREEKKAWYSGYHNTKNVTFYIASEVFKGRWNILGHYFSLMFGSLQKSLGCFRKSQSWQTKISCIWLGKSWQLWIRTCKWYHNIVLTRTQNNSFFGEVFHCLCCFCKAVLWKERGISKNHIKWAFCDRIW